MMPTVQMKTQEACLKAITELVQRLDAEILLGKYNLSLTVEFLAHFDRVLREANQLEGEGTSIKVMILEPRSCILQSFFHRLITLRITGCPRSEGLFINLIHFGGLQELDLDNVCLDSLLSLDLIRGLIKRLTIRRYPTTSSLEKLLQPSSWSSLRQLSVTKATLSTLDTEMLSPSIQYLDLSWNLLMSIKVAPVLSLTTLDLSFNRLKNIPTSTGCQSLKSLRLKGNLIESLDGIRMFNNLVELDLSQNFLVDLDQTVVFLTGFESLRRLNLQANPILCHSKAHEELQKILPRLETICRGELLQQSSAKDRRRASLAVRPVVNLEDAIIYEEEPSTSMGADEPFIVVSRSSRRRKPQTTKESPSIEVAQTRRASQDLPVTPPPTPFDMSITAGVNLLSSSPFERLRLNISPPAADYVNPSPDSSPLINGISPIDVSDKNEEDHEGIEVLPKHVEENEVVWSRDDLGDEENVFMVEREDSNEDGKRIDVFISVKDGLLIEKNCVTGKLLNSFDLSVLVSVEVVGDSSEALKMVFDTRVKSRSYCVYWFDSRDSRQNFQVVFVKPHIEQKMESDRLKQIRVECLKCGFSAIRRQRDLKNCPSCGSEVIMEHEVVENQSKPPPRNDRDRRSESDISVLHRGEANEAHQPNNDSWDNIEHQSVIYDDETFFTTIDHEAQLLFDVKVLDNDELFRAMFKCRVHLSNRQNGFDAAIVLSSKNVFVFEEMDNHLVETPSLRMPFSTLSKVESSNGLLNRISLIFHWTQCEYPKSKRTKNKQKAIADFAVVIFRDGDLRSSFIRFLNRFSVDLGLPLNSVKLVTRSDFSLNAECEMIKALDSKENGSSFIISVTFERALIVNQLQVKYGGEYQLKPVKSQTVINLVTPVQVSSSQKQLILHFEDEEGVHSDWKLSFVSMNALVRILSVIRKFWEEDFAVPLELIVIELSSNSSIF